MRLPPGVWQARRLDVMAMEDVALGAEAVGTCRIDAPASRAVLFVFRKILDATGAPPAAAPRS